MSETNDFKGKAGLFAATAAKKARGLAVYAATKTKQLSRIAKLNVDIASQKDTIKTAYTEIGKLYYEAHKDAPEGFFLQLCQEIDTANQAIAQMEEEIAQLKAESAAPQEAEPAEDADFATIVDEAEADIQVEIVPEEDTIFQEVVETEIDPVTPAQAEPVTEEPTPTPAEEPEPEPVPAPEPEPREPEAEPEPQPEPEPEPTADETATPAE
jgi:outer membrane biosynthesis protein TonB